MSKKPNILMCSPDYFTVSYVINPWMEGNESNVVSKEAQIQWNKLYTELSKVANISLLTPQKDLPDLVFTANAGLVFNNIFVPSNFFHPERQREESIFTSWFEKEGYEIKTLPKNISFEGAGDALFDKKENILWSAHGFRSGKSSSSELELILQFEVVKLKLVDQRFYHLDTCLCPLTNGYLLYFPKSFDEESIIEIKKHKSDDLIIEVEEEDALHFACNAVNIDQTVFLNNCSKKLEAQLNKKGFNVIKIKLTEFLKSGGASKCLTLRLDEIHKVINL